MKVSITLPDKVVKEIDSMCSTQARKNGVSSGRSRWIAELVLKHLKLNQDLLFDHNSKRGPRK